MMVSNQGSVFRLLLWQWRAASFFLLSATLALMVYKLGWLKHIKIPLPPLAIVGGAIGIFVSFRTNSAYARWWEGRKLWGRMINSSRHFCNQVLAYLTPPNDATPEQTKRIEQLRRMLIERHVIYVHSLRSLLRQQDPFADEEIQRFVKDPKHYTTDLCEGVPKMDLTQQDNLTHALLSLQQTALTQLANEGLINEFRLQSLDKTLASFLDIQGGCERIKKTPLPRGYGFIAERLILAFGFLLPFPLVQEIHAWVVPANLLVCIAFTMISEAGRVLEDPFTMFWNGLPLSALSTTIEINLRQRLGDEDLPPPRTVDHRGILM
ncbi:MAG: hypothetical protein H6728_04175 [Myxococcales bacterium]|nr:hypothetical protein [Myxococcales bacterium]MCB9642248.1 hypothetical protein [Myxococcales bacterium]